MPNVEPPNTEQRRSGFGQEIAELIVGVSTLTARAELKRFDVMVGGEFVDDSSKAREQYIRAKESLRDVEDQLAAFKKALGEAINAALSGRRPS